MRLMSIAITFIGAGSGVFSILGKDFGVDQNKVF